MITYSAFFFLLMSIIGVSSVIRSGANDSVADLLFCLAFVGAGIVLNTYHQQHSRYKGFWHRPSNILLLGLLLVNFQYIVDLVIGYKSYNDFLRPGVVNRCCYYCAIGVMAYLAGLNMKRRAKSGVKRVPMGYPKIDISFLSFIQVTLFLLWFMTIDVVTLLLGFQYGVDSESNPFEGLFFQTTIALLICIALNFRSGSVKRFKDFLAQGNFACWLCTVCYMVMRLVSGDRGPFIYTAFAVFFTYIFVSKAKIKLGYIVAAMFLGTLLISLVGMARNDAASGSFVERIGVSYDEYNTSKTARFSDKTILNSTEELARSSMCNQIAVDEIENKKEPLHYGKYQIYQLLNCIPYMPSFMAKTLSIPPKERSSDAYLTMVYYGDYNAYGQIGTTCIADFFMDFGVWGIILGMFVLGLIFRWVDETICIDRNIGPFMMIVALLFACKCFYIPRSTMIAQIKPLLIVTVLFYTNIILFNRKWKRA